MRTTQQIKQGAFALFALCLVLLPGCSNLLSRTGPPPAPVTTPSPPATARTEPEPGEGEKVHQVGEASWYGPHHQGKETANGDVFDQNKLTAASPTLPLGAQATVTNLETGKSVKVIVNDRGPYVKGRKIDLSRAAAHKIGVTKQGVAKVKITATVPRKTKHTLARRRAHPDARIAQNASTRSLSQP